MTRGSLWYQFTIWLAGKSFTELISGRTQPGVLITFFSMGGKFLQNAYNLIR